MCQRSAKGGGAGSPRTGRRMTVLKDEEEKEDDRCICDGCRLGGSAARQAGGGLTCHLRTGRDAQHCVLPPSAPLRKPSSPPRVSSGALAACPRLLRQEYDEYAHTAVAPRAPAQAGGGGRLSLSLPAWRIEGSSAAGEWPRREDRITARRSRVTFLFHTEA